MTGTPKNLFQKHLHDGLLSAGWGEDLARFTAQDWRDFIIFSYTIDAMNILADYAEDQDYQDLQASIPSAYWQALTAEIGTRQAHEETRMIQNQLNMVLSKLFDIHPRLLNLNNCFEEILGRRKAPARTSAGARPKLAEGLRLAIMAYDGSTSANAIIEEMVRLSHSFVEGSGLPDISVGELQQAMQKIPNPDEDFIGYTFSAAIAERTTREKFAAFARAQKEVVSWRPDNLAPALDVFIRKDTQNWFKILCEFRDGIAAMSPGCRNNFFDYNVIARLNDELGNPKTDFRELAINPVIRADPVKDRAILQWLFDPTHESFLRWGISGGMNRLSIVVRDGDIETETRAGIVPLSSRFPQKAFMLVKSACAPG